MNILNNPILSTDSYKFSHFMQYPEGTTFISSYIEARGSNVPGVKEVVFFGLQAYIKERLLTPVTMAAVREADDFCQKHGVPFNREGWEYIVREHNGLLPVRIYAPEEGTPVPINECMVHVENTDDKCAWLVSYLETDILRAVWYPSTVATISREAKKIIKRYLDDTADNSDCLAFKLHDFKLHDFGFRGVSSFESAAIGGAAHLINFMGTDTVAGIGFAECYYDADVCGFSLPASEHSTMTIRGRAGESDSYYAMVKAYAKPGAMFACVIDSYNWREAARMWTDRRRELEGESILDLVKNVGATVVLRPDSGDPTKVPVELIEILWDRTPEKLVNSKGYKMLPPYVRVIQGDGITIETIPVILENIKRAGFSTDNIAMGMGGGLLQKVDRDTFKFAMKASYAIINDEGVEVYKDPIDGGKTSKKGYVRLLKNKKTGEYSTGNGSHDAIPADHVVFEHYKDRTRTSFIDFNRVRENAKV